MDATTLIIVSLAAVGGGVNDPRATPDAAGPTSQQERDAGHGDPDRPATQRRAQHQGHVGRVAPIPSCSTW